ncbi:unnamed protein product [Nippostrongylus brasiliensis]|uniref:5' nucleotidase, deoxy (Pyrimidine), cytosolic type C protein (NT5C) n=1 Tax=Nippostrongylus brasiliensis TaxID=27835 RepID=A0A0N4YRW0_NIPBR|nr:unnamed protein product [Nippostrongylus brasiliensis]
MRVVLTLNFDGVCFKELTRSQAWPIYIRFEGLPFNMKNDPENMVLPAIMFLRKTPTETLPTNSFYRLKEELRILKESGVKVEDSTGTLWTCYPVVLNGVIEHYSPLETILKHPNLF